MFINHKSVINLKYVYKSQSVIKRCSNHYQSNMFINHNNYNTNRFIKPSNNNTTQFYKQCMQFIRAMMMIVKSLSIKYVYKSQVL